MLSVNFNNSCLILMGGQSNNPCRTGDSVLDIPISSKSQDLWILLLTAQITVLYTINFENMSHGCKNCCYNAVDTLINIKLNQISNSLNPNKKNMKLNKFFSVIIYLSCKKILA